jgi:hypothetical protein
MGTTYTDIQWNTQQNLTNKDDLYALTLACERMGVLFVEIDTIPFTDQLHKTEVMN